jgi:hypothetical protein
MSGNALPPQFLRRDFLVGAAAGVAATGAAGWLGRAQTPPAGPAGPSYAQTGEDVIIASLFEYLQVARPTYLDIGAFLPIFSNNTYLFYSKGSRGVLVEPNVALIPELRKRRPGDTVLDIGVGVTGDDSADYYQRSGKGLETRELST